jgi:hypothetical protein
MKRFSSLFVAATMLLSVVSASASPKIGGQGGAKANNLNLNKRTPTPRPVGAPGVLVPVTPIQVRPTPPVVANPIAHPPATPASKHNFGGSWQDFARGWLQHHQHHHHGREHAPPSAGNRPGRKYKVETMYYTTDGRGNWRVVGEYNSLAEAEAARAQQPVPERVRITPVNIAQPK